MFTWNIYVFVCVCLHNFFTKFEISEVIGVSAVVIFYAVATLDAKFWRVMVEGDVIKYRLLYGITRTYSFNDISKGVYTQRGSLIYIGEKGFLHFMII